MKFFLSYVKQRRRTVVIFSLFGLIFMCSFFLYHLPIKAVLYPFALCFLFAMIYLWRDYHQVYLRHVRLQELMKYQAEQIESLPNCRTAIEEDYNQLVNQLKMQERTMQEEAKLRYSDMMEYYTTWVHQIKTPIASMRLTLQNEDSELSRKLAEDLFRIEQYVEMVLCYLRLDEGTTDYVIQEYQLDNIVRQAIRKYAGQFIRRGLRLDYEPFAAKIITDEKWLLFVVEQVLSNALKYTFSGTITIGLIEPKTIYIKDTGIGIAPEDLPRVFDKGYTGYNGRSDKRASGIGLYLCRRICKRLGHKISIQSKVGEGTTVLINLDQKKLEVE